MGEILRDTVSTTGYGNYGFRNRHLPYRCPAQLSSVGWEKIESHDYRKNGLQHESRLPIIFSNTLAPAKARSGWGRRRSR